MRYQPLLYRKNGEVSGAMSPVMAAKIICKQQNFRLDGLVRVWFDSEEVHNLYEGPGKTCLTGCDTLMVLSRHENLDQVFTFVDDSSPHSTGGLEVAVVDQQRGQIESITVGWVKSLGEVTRYFRECLLPDAPVVNKNIRVPILTSEIKIVSLICGCCGEYFRDDFHKQQKFGQDSGFGICSSCETVRSGKGPPGSLASGFFVVADRLTSPRQRIPVLFCLLAENYSPSPPVSYTRFEKINEKALDFSCGIIVSLPKQQQKTKHFTPWQSLTLSPNWNTPTTIGSTENDNRRSIEAKQIRYN